jgi:hypothetical protein
MQGINGVALSNAFFRLNGRLRNAAASSEVIVGRRSPRRQIAPRSLYAMCAMYPLPGQSLTDVPVDLFLHEANRHLRNCSRAFWFWWPIIHARAEHHSTSAADLLLNPLFRWAFRNRSEKLAAFEAQIALLEIALGTSGVQGFRDQVFKDLKNHSIENDTHNRVLSAMVEVRAALHFARESYRVALIPPGQGRRTPDFRVTKDSETFLVEAKYIRPPNKLGEYLLRWWQAQKEVAGEILLGSLPHLRFDWQPIESRSELSQHEIDILKDLFLRVLQEPDRRDSITSGRLVVSYVPNRKLPISTTPIPAKAVESEANRAGLFQKLRRDVEDASEQLAIQAKGQQPPVLFLALNLSPDITFFWPDHFNERLEVLRQEALSRGVSILVQEVGYL